MIAPTTTATARRSPAWPWLAVPLSLVLGALSVVLTPRRIWTGSSDPSFYLGYALDYGDLASRYGQTYHGNRLSYLLPEMGAFALLGPERGYLVLRAVMLAVAALTVLLVAEPRVGRSAAVVVAVVTVAVPLLARQLLWTHFDGFAAVYLLVAAALLLDDRDRRWRQLLAGVLLGLVVNANLVYLLFVGALGLAWMVTAERPAARRAVGAGTVLGGVVAVELGLSAVLRGLGAAGPWFIEVVPLRFALRHVGDDTWFTPLRTALADSPRLLVIVAVAVLAGLTARGPRAGAGRDVARLAAWWLGIALALLLVGHVVFRVNWLSAPQYVVLLAPATLLGLVAVLAGLGAGRPDVRRPAAAVVATVWTLGLLLLWAGAGAGPATSGLALAAAAAAATALLRGDGRWTRAVALVLSPALVLPAWGYAPPEAAPALGARSEGELREWDVFRAIVAVQSLVGAEISTERDLVFWHAVEGPDADHLRRINMVQYGRGAGRLHRDKGELIGLPDLPPVLVDELRARVPITVIVLARDRPELLSGLVALSSAVPDARQTVQQVVEGDVLDVHVALVEVG